MMNLHGMGGLVGGVHGWVWLTIESDLCDCIDG